ncbi:hypothetical protein ES703_110640 [subsurface metagenome]
MKDALGLADRLRVDVNIFSSEQSEVRERLPQLPASCWESAESLLRDREVYERDGVFPSIVIDWIINKLKSYNDKDLSKRLSDKDELKKLIAEYLHCG